MRLSEYQGMSSIKPGDGSGELDGAEELQAVLS